MEGSELVVRENLEGVYPLCRTLSEIVMTANTIDSSPGVVTGAELCAFGQFISSIDTTNNMIIGWIRQQVDTRLACQAAVFHGYMQNVVNNIKFHSKRRPNFMRRLNKHHHHM